PARGGGVAARAPRGRFRVYGLDVGGPYVVEVRRIGFQPRRSPPLYITLGEPLELQFVLPLVAIPLERVLVTGPEAGASVLAGGGTATVIHGALLHRLPTLNRNLLDFVPLTPQVSTKIGLQRSGMSAAGANLRYNNYLVNGAHDRSINSNVAPANTGRSIPLDAVKEYQVLVAPYDVRYGEFAGALVNTVTQSGTNQLRGTTSGYWRSDRLRRGGGGGPDSSRYERWQYGFALGGPVLRDRVHFFVAPELQRLTSPARGPYLGQPAGASPAVPVSDADVRRFATIMRDVYGLGAGSGRSVEIESPVRSLFARVDAAIPRWNSRAIAFASHAGAEDGQLTRSARDFYLSSAQQTAASRTRLAAVQLHTELPRLGGGHNELLVSHSAELFEQRPAVRQPLVRVSVPGQDGLPASLLAGAVELAQGTFRRARSLEMKDELTLPLGAGHVLLLGIQGERFRIQPGGVRGGYGTWTFASLEALERGVAEKYELRKDFGSASAPLRGGQYAAYVGDEWRASERISFTMGLRGDLLRIDSRAPYNAAVDSTFGRRTDEMPRARLHASPRAGFTWDPSGTGRDALRGGVGVFTGRPPLAWLHPAIANYGVGIGVLRCGSSNDASLPPQFVPDYRAAPLTCASGQRPKQRGDVDLLDRNLRMAQALRASLAYDRRLPWGLLATGEILLTRYRADFRFVNLNLEGPRAVDRFGRVLYGTIDLSGIPHPALIADQFAEVIDLRNTSRNHSRQFSARLERRFARGLAATASYTSSRTRDVQSPSRVNMAGLTVWGDARAVSGRHEDVVRETSLNDVPHRVVAALTYAAPWRRWPTSVALYYVGESGGPFTYRAGGLNGRGDLNADGSDVNDPIYVPRSAQDTTEVRFDGQVTGSDSGAAVQAERVRAQQTAFDRFIARSPCLRRQRGRILERNSCREPWSHTTVGSVQQAVAVGGRALEVELDVFNVLNLLNGAWGHYRVADPVLLEHVREEGPLGATQPLFHFNPARAEWTLESESAFQLQLAVRYRF
ncbi:MAG: TonB-dependent receptor domain-containing protein, partial [Gemmatimonadaceae bacterium]